MAEKNVLEEDLERVVAELTATLETIPQAPVPFDSVKLTRAEQQQRFQALTEDDWRQMLKDKPWPEVLDYARTMQRRGRKAQEEEGGQSDTATAD